MRRIILFASILLPVIVHSQIRLNEIMSNNVSFIMDDAYNYSMWVEVYNTSATDIQDLNDYYFTDNLSEPTKWNPQSRKVLANGYDTLWFERDDRVGHASFKLEPEGGTLYLLNHSLQVVDFVVYQAQYRNISYGRQTDNASNWVFFEQPSPGATNNNCSWSTQRCSNPVFSLQNGFYNTSQLLSFITIPAGDTIYYTTNHTEPTKTSIHYQNGTTISLDTTTVIRAKAFSSGKLSSDVVSSTFFIHARRPDLRVVSISTDQDYLTNDTIGIYCDGTNGITGNLQKTPKNFNQDWDRPVNFELFDETGGPCLNQELDIKIVGGGSREHELKSISISPKKKFGDNQLRYDIFKATKPGHKYKDIQMRNSGNDFKRTMMKDAFLQSIVINRMDVDYQAYEPAIIFMNGVYCGIENMRERCNKDFVFSNFGLDDDEVTLIEATYKGVDSQNDIPTDAGFAELSNFLKNNPMSDDVNYREACKRIDVDEFINYLMTEIYVGNVDWPYNNVKMWKRTVDGKWRWILMDLEYCYGLGRIAHNTLTFALGENPASVIGGYDTAPEWSTIVFTQLIKNETFLNKFIDRFCIHLSTTFEPTRVIQIMDSISSRIRDEIPYHQARYNITDNFQNDLDIFKTFATQRPEMMLGFISERFLSSVEIQTIRLSANISGATYRMNSESIIDSDVTISYFKDRKIDLEANPIPGYRFKHWILGGLEYTEPVYSEVMDGNLKLMAIYEPSADSIEIKTIFINEVVTSNQTIPDEVGEKDDYIELYNNGTDAVNIAGWYLTNTLSNKTLAQIPSSDYTKTVIPAKGRLIVWTDNQSEQGILHLCFKLSKDGDTIVLSKMNDDSLVVVVDSVVVPGMNSDMSYSRMPDGNLSWVVQAPTWNAPNTALFLPEPLVSTVTIYPTMVTESFHVRDASGSLLTIADLTGRIWSRTICVSDDELISMGDLQYGLYIVTVGRQTFKIIKK